MSSNLADRRHPPRRRQLGCLMDEGLSVQLRSALDNSDAISTVVANDHVISLASGDVFESSGRGSTHLSFPSSDVSVRWVFVLSTSRSLEPAGLQGKRIESRNRH